MDEYYFIDHINNRLGKFLERYYFLLNEKASRSSSGFQNNFFLFESPHCQLRIYLEHYKVYIEISALDVKDPNLWYNVDMMACFVSNTSPSQWIYNLPRGIPLSQVIDRQLDRWQTILDKYFDDIIPMFASKDLLYNMRETLDAFVLNYYSEQKSNLK